MSLELSRVRVLRGGRPLLDDVSLELLPGQLLALVGPNGAGKTSLLRAMLGLLQPASGSVRIGGKGIAELSARERAAQLAWLPQHMSITEELSAVEVVMAARFRFDEPFHAAEVAARRALARVGVAALAERSLLTLSGGERQRVALAGLVAQAAPLLLLDEPANHLDPAQQIDVYRLVGELWREGSSVVCVTHDVNLLRHLGEPERVRVAGIEAGRLRFECNLLASELPQQLGQLFGIRMRELELDGQRVLLAEPNA